GASHGTYTLFQTQPDDLIDSLDTPGSTGGLAVNAADTYDENEQLILNSVAGTDSMDAILAISVLPGETSIDNWFSEIEIKVVEPPLRDLPEEAAPRDRVLAPSPQFFEPREILFGEGERERVLPKRYDTTVDVVTWHLSIINGGFPRGKLQAKDAFVKVAFKNLGAQSSAKQAKGSWRLVTLEGEVLEMSNAMTLGAEDAIALAGDFNGDGEDEVAIYVGGEWFVDLNGNGVWDSGDLWILLGTEMDRPVVGDWDGDGKDDIGIYGRRWEQDLRRVKADAGLPDPANRSRRYLESRKTRGLVSKQIRDTGRERILRRDDENVLRADAVDHVFLYGEDVDTPIAGDWNGDGIDQIGFFRAGTWVLDEEGDGRRKESEAMFEYGRPGDQPVVGDFDGDGIDEVGVIRGNVWIIDTDGDRKLTAADERIEMGSSEGQQPLTGDWDGDGQDELGYYRKAE
ncbi:MAG: fibrinogen-binding protein, partial [Planctomycetota bacterium]